MTTEEMLILDGVASEEFKVWMQTDDIKLSKIYAIAKAYGTNIRWKLAVKS